MPGPPPPPIQRLLNLEEVGHHIWLREVRGEEFTN